jgi:nucleoside-diphosphate kinase
MERTLAIIKPDGAYRNIIGKIIERIESNEFRIVAIKRVLLAKPIVARFYDVHKERPFFDSLCTFMSSGPVILMVLEHDNAIFGWRELMGATNPTEAVEGTIRKEFGINLEENTVHGSDSPENAAFEIPFFFSETEILS